MAILIPYFNSGAVVLIASDAMSQAAAVTAGYVPGFEYATGTVTDADLLLPVIFSDHELRDHIERAGGPEPDIACTSAQLAMALLRAKGKTAYDRVEVSSVAASSGTASGGTSVTITGTGFSLGRGGTPTVMFGGTAATAIAVVSDTSITCTTPAHSAGAVSVVVANANGSHTKASAFTFT